MLHILNGKAKQFSLHYIIGVEGEAMNLLKATFTPTSPETGWLPYNRKILKMDCIYLY